MQNTRELILAKLNEINDLLYAATCDNTQLVQCDKVWEEVNSAMAALEGAVEYYVD